MVNSKYIREEIFFGVEEAFIKKMFWCSLSVIITLFFGAPGVVLALVLTGLYFKKGGKAESLSFAKYYGLFLLSIAGFVLFPTLFVIALS